MIGSEERNRGEENAVRVNSDWDFIKLGIWRISDITTYMFSFRKLL